MPGDHDNARSNDKNKHLKNIKFTLDQDTPIILHLVSCLTENNKYDLFSFRLVYSNK